MRKKKSRESFTVSITLEKCKVYKYRKCRVVLCGVGVYGGGVVTR
jgi:hypothetical protein